MRGYYRNKIVETNSWIDNKDKFGLILTDDIDSLLSCAILKKVNNWNIEQIMLFNINGRKGIDCLGVAENTTNETIGVDFAMYKGKCFDNHLTKFTSTDSYNIESVNFNHMMGINRSNYMEKYNLSTVLLLWSLYDMPKTGLSDELMMLLLAIDSSYYSFYKGFERQNHKWLVDVLDLPEFYACQQRHKEYEFMDITKKYHLKDKINVHGGILDTTIAIDKINQLLEREIGMMIELPVNKFYRKSIFKDVEVDIEGYPNSINAICDNPFCYAMTRKNKVKYSERIEN